MAELVREVLVDASPETIWPLLVDPARHVEWMGTEAEIDARPGGTHRVLVGGRQSDGRVFFLLDASTSYYDLYVFELRVNDWVGWSAAFLKTDAFPTNGLTMFGRRLTGPSDAPASAPGAAADMDSIEAMKVATSARAATRPAVDGKAVRVDDIEAMLPALKQALSKLH